MTTYGTVEGLRRWLVEQIAEICDLTEDEVDVRTPFGEFGLSSRNAVELSGELEDLLDRVLPTTLIWAHPTIERLAEALAGEEGTETAETAPDNGTGEDAADPIAIVGLGCRLPGGVHGPAEFWRLLSEGRDAITEVDPERWAGYPGAEGISNRGGFLTDIAGFDAEFFGIAPREAARMDPQQRMLLEVVWEALEHAGIAPESLRGSRTGVFVGISGTEYGSLSLADLAGVDAWAGTGAALAIAANRLSYVLDLRGPSLSVDTACSSSLTAVHLAVQSLRSGESEVALVGGANLLLGPGVNANFDQMGITSADGRCKPFSADADGIGRAEGAGVVVLKRLSAARADGDRVLAVIRGSATNSDGRSNGLTAPNPEAQQELLRDAYRHAGVSPTAVDYVEAHGTGTLLGDPIEARALGAVLGADRPARRPLLLGSVKSNLGHLEAAAGIVGLIKVVLSLRHGEIPASLNYAGPNPHIAFDELGLSVVDSHRDWPEGPAIAGVSGFGFGGTNAHVVLERAEPADPEPSEMTVRQHRLLLGGGDAGRLADTAGNLADWLSGEGAAVPLADVEHTLARRLDGRVRAAVAGSDTGELVAGLRALARGEQAPGVATGTRRGPGTGPVFVFSGHGSQWAGMGKRLLAGEPVFAAAIDRLDPLIRAEAGFSLREDLVNEVEAGTMDHVQPLVFGIQLALAELWRAYGVRPSAVIGHSFGEVAAAVVAGALTEADGARIVALRSRLLASLAGDGAMALLELGAEEAGELVDGLSDVDIAVLSAPNQTVIAGSADQVRRIVSDVDSRGLLAKLVKLDVAAHSPIVDRVTDTLVDGLAGLTAAEPLLGFYSTALPDPRRRPEFDPAYWATNLRQPVRFAGAVAAALTDGLTGFVEISPHPVLRHALADNLAALGRPDALVLSTLRNDQDEATHFHSQLGALEIAGMLSPSRPEGTVTALPGTPWRHVRHWLPRSATTPTAAGTHPLLGAHVEQPDDDKHLWRADLGSAAEPWLSDHRLDDRPVLPGSAYLEMANAAARTVFEVPAERVALRALTMQQPLPLGEHTAVTTVLKPAGPGRAKITVHTKSADGRWQSHASVDAHLVGPGETAPCVAEVDTSGFTEVSAAELYQRLRSLGVGYGPALTGMSAPRVSRRASAGRLRAVARIALPEEAGPVRGMRLHPALVDSCLQAFAAALFDPTDTDSGAAYMPMEFGSIRVYGDLSTAESVHVSVTEPVAGSVALTGELHLVDAGNRTLLEIGEVFVRRVERAELAAPLTDRLLEAVWRPSPLPEGPGEPTDRLVLLHAGGHRLLEPLAANGPAVRQADYRDETAVAEALAGPDPVSVVVLPPDSGTGLEAIAEAERAVLGIADTVRALAERAGTARLWLVTTGTAAVTAQDQVRPGMGALRGLVRVLAYEHPELRTTMVDLAPDTGVRDLLAELASGTEDEVAWRADGRHAHHLRWAAPPAEGTLDRPVVRPDGAYVLTGGLGGLGVFLAGQLAEQGAARIVLNGRSAPKPDVVRAIAAMDTEVEVVLGDLADEGTAERLREAATAGGVPLRGVLHAAAVFDDRTTSGLDAETLHRSWLPKAYGAWRLHEATLDVELDWWLGFSSTAALTGLPGQPAYASANAYLDALTEMRRAQGLPGASIAWGTWSEVGAAAELEIPWVHPLSPDEGVAALTTVLAEGRGNTGALRLNGGSLVDAFPVLLEIPFFGDLLAEHARAAEQAGGWPGVAELRALAPEQARAAAAGQLRARVASILGFATDSLDTASPLSALGVDSLLAVRIRNAVQHDFELSLPVSLLLRGASVAETEQWLFGELGLDSGPVTTAPARTEKLIGPRDAAERLVARAWQDVLGAEVGVTQDFYGIGGSREKAEQVTALLAERSGRELIVSELFEHPSIERMAAHLREEEHDGSPVRVLREHGTQRPLFFFHPGGGDTAVYRQLTGLLDAELPVYGFDRLEGVSSVEDRVSHYLPELRLVQPHGPYRLAGWSFGGFLAFEMAQQLRRAGEQVEVLAMIDSILPLPNETGLSDVELMEKRFGRFQEFLEASYGRRVELPYARLARLDADAQSRLLADTMRSEGLIDSSVSDAILNHQRTSFLDARSLEAYQPDGYDGPVMFFSAADQVPGGLRDQRFDRTDPARGWDAVCPELELVTVPGHHLSLLDPPNVDHIAKHLDELFTITGKPVGTRGRS
ncbi:type I polyketide synthase [Amycolatopsis nigrescens]|uniref:type I polyketide synthase n=1 Tax=Amycolatopsis nigrescens TaxID=381445 RepID=UPI0003A6828A|nr:type I polyketide synthase [Amycolatopsis nigrescens]